MTCPHIALSSERSSGGGAMATLRTGATRSPERTDAATQRADKNGTRRPGKMPLFEPSFTPFA